MNKTLLSSTSLFWLIAKIFGLGIVMVAAFVFLLSLTLPDVTSLRHFQFQEPLRVFTKDGQLVAEFGEIKCIPLSLDHIPPLITQALLATEDHRFYRHTGVDLIGLGRASLILLATGEKRQGGSTITMQVARNFYLSREKTFFRKLKEILLAVKIDRTLDKEKILELYLNKVFYGYRAHGIAAAAQIYYGKTLQELTLSEIALLTGLPKAPSVINPLVNPVAAQERRNYVLAHMLDLKMIDQVAYEQAMAEPVAVTYHGIKPSIKAPHAAEMVRESMIKLYGEEAYTQGFSVYTTLDSTLQKSANRAVQQGLLKYDRRHGYRGSLARWEKPTADLINTWKEDLQKISTVNDLQPAVVLSLGPQSAEVMLKNGERITLPWTALSWARRQIRHEDQDYLGSFPRTASEVLRPGDLIRVLYHEKMGWQLSQIPEVESALIALHPQNGSISALVGGFDFAESKFNRATQAERQPGSSLKPFIYSAALEKGYTLASTILDAPVVTENSGEDRLWRPENSTHRFYGLTRLRDALTHSRNLVSIRLLRNLDLTETRTYLSRFGFNEKQLPEDLSLALGTASVTPLQMTRAFAVFANGGYLITPYLIDHIINAKGEVLYQAKPFVAPSETESNFPPAPQVISSQNAYLITSALKDVIRYGTAQAANFLHRNDLAGKTGTTDDKLDAWFCGYNGNLVTVVWMGFDQHHSLHEYAYQAAVPLWSDFMKEALQNQPAANFPLPPDILVLPIDKTTGLLSPANDENTMMEFFQKGTEPTEVKESSPSSSPYSNDSESQEQIY